MALKCKHSLEMVKLLLEGQSFSQSLFDLREAFSSYSISSFSLLAGQCDVNSRSEDGRSALHHAVADVGMCSPIAVRLLLLSKEKKLLAGRRVCFRKSLQTNIYIYMICILHTSILNHVSKDDITTHL